MKGALGQIPSWMEDLVEPANERSWELLRDLNLGKDAELSGREKALVGVGVAAVINCPYCIYLHTEGIRLSGVTNEELGEAINLTANTKYFPIMLHGSETDLDESKAETGEIIKYITKQQAPADD